MAAECRILMVSPQPTAVVKITVPMSEIPKAQKEARAKIEEALPKLDAGTSGYGCTLWRPPVKDELYMEPGLIVTRSFMPAGEVVASELPGGRAAHYLMRGPYDGLPDAWKMLLGWVEQRNLKPAGINWEIYGDDHPDPSRLKTQLYVLLR